jgi:hypothetical protein
VRLTVDGAAQNASLHVNMDPRSPATAAVLEQQLQLGKQIFAETIDARRALAEINSVQKQVADLQKNTAEQHPELQTTLAETQSALGKILSNAAAPADAGLEDAYTNLVTVLGVVEGSDRTVPSQAIAAYDQASQQIKSRIAEWGNFKRTRLDELNRRLRDAGVSPITISEIEREVEYLMTR